MATTDTQTPRPVSIAPVVAEQLGPRQPGVIYGNVDGAEARRILKRRSAQFAVIVIDTLRSGAEPFPVGSVWTGSDRVLKAVA